MQILRPEFDLEAFFQKLARAPQRLLLLDYDGTLAPFRAERDQAWPYPGVRQTLSTILDETDSRLVLISGRKVEELRSLLGIEPPPEMWGSHGRERYSPEQGYQFSEIGALAAAGLSEAKEWVGQEQLQTWLEEKPGSLALHFRGKPPAEIEKARRKALKAWSGLASRSGLRVHEFDGGLELRVPGVDKGHAVRTMLAEIIPQAAAAYLGDDQTDEDAFEALEGRGLSVLVRDEFRPTRADLWIRPPEELLDFLRTWGDLSRGKS